jgi:hypothetical protein
VFISLSGMPAKQSPRRRLHERSLLARQDAAIDSPTSLSSPSQSGQLIPRGFIVNILFILFSSTLFSVLFPELNQQMMLQDPPSIPMTCNMTLPTMLGLFDSKSV